MTVPCKAPELSFIAGEVNGQMVYFIFDCRVKMTFEQEDLRMMERVAEWII